MRGDFTRDSFDRRHHYTRVLMQQGRVQLDADWNEQGAIAQHYARTLAADMIGPHGGPVAACGFEMVTDPAVVDSLTDELGLPLAQARVEELKGNIDRGDFLIGLGRYYVDGLLCESDVPMTYSEQLGYPFEDDTTLQQLSGVNGVLVYLDVWERQVAGSESADILDVALGGTDTATRAQLVWQVKVHRGDGPLACADYLTLSRPRLPLLRARATEPQEQLDACIIDPEARYRGAENQLYRVEIHRGGRARVAGEVVGGATFKWSRENGWLVFPVLQYAEDGSAGETILELAGLGRDRRLGLDHGDWVELVDDQLTLRGGTEALRAVVVIGKRRSMPPPWMSNSLPGTCPPSPSTRCASPAGRDPTGPATPPSKARWVCGPSRERIPWIPLAARVGILGGHHLVDPLARQRAVVRPGLDVEVHVAEPSSAA